MNFEKHRHRCKKLKISLFVQSYVDFTSIIENRISLKLFKNTVISENKKVDDVKNLPKLSDISLKLYIIKYIPS